MRVYIAGPYTKGDVAMNVRRAIEEGNKIADVGHTPFIPHLTHFWHMLFPHEYSFWMKQDRAWLHCCKAIIRIPGDSYGAEEEVREAKRHGIEVYGSAEEFLEAYRDEA